MLSTYLLFSLLTSRDIYEYSCARDERRHAIWLASDTWALMATTSPYSKTQRGDIGSYCTWSEWIIKWTNKYQKIDNDWLYSKQNNEYIQAKCEGSQAVINNVDDIITIHRSQYWYTRYKWRTVTSTTKRQNNQTHQNEDSLNKNLMI